MCKMWFIYLTILIDLIFACRATAILRKNQGNKCTRESNKSGQCNLSHKCTKLYNYPFHFSTNFINILPHVMKIPSIVEKVGVAIAKLSSKNFYQQMV